MVKLDKGVCCILWLATSPILGSQCFKEDSDKGGISICKPYIHVHNHKAFVWNLQHCQYVWTRGVQCLVSCLFMKFAQRTSQAGSDPPVESVNCGYVFCQQKQNIFYTHLCVIFHMSGKSRFAGFLLEKASNIHGGFPSHSAACGIQNEEIRYKAWLPAHLLH